MCGLKKRAIPSHSPIVIILISLVVAYGTETGIAPSLVLWKLLKWGLGECWACLVLSIACRLVEDLALDVSQS